MERLSFSSNAGYSAPEAAVHMARYMVAASYCKGRRVLDVACGEGYGSLVLKRMGAASVEAVDASSSAVETARTLFADDGITYHEHDAERVDELFDANSFDLIVALETIEHLRNPRRFLEALRKIAKPEAVIIVSCPNDHWYYPSEHEANPYHVRKYSFPAFRNLTTSTLGNNVTWGYGLPIIGFGSISDDLPINGTTADQQTTMLEFRRQAGSIVLPPVHGSHVGSRNCSYFVGVWGDRGAQVYASAFFPVSMDEYSRIMAWQEVRATPADFTALKAREATLDNEVAAARARIRDLETHQADSAASVERHSNELADARDRIAVLDSSLAERNTTISCLQLEADRHRLQATALLKELDIVKNRDLRGKISELMASAKERARDLERANARCEALERALELADARCVTLEASIAEQNRNLTILRCEADKHRVQAVALTKETELIGSRLIAVVAERDHAKHRTGEVIAERDRFRDERDALAGQLATARLDTDRNRIRALALLKETEILSTRAALGQGALPAHQHSSVVAVVASSPFLKMRASMSRMAPRSNGKRALLLVARTVKPLLPPKALRLAERVARELNI